MDKKAFEIQFNWIFVLVAGATILLFFSVIVIKQKAVSETSTKATVLKSFEAIITGTSVSTDTTSIIDIPSSDIEVSCGRISLGRVSNQYQNLVLFSPALIKGNRLITHTLAFSTPYRATNLLYITSPNLRYIIIGDSNLAREINSSLPSRLKKEFYNDATQIKNQNNYKVKFAVFGDMIDFPKSLEEMPDSDVEAARFTGNSWNGIVDFYAKEKSSWQRKGSSAYIGKASLIGAVYSGKEMYDCNMENIFFRLNLVTKVYIDKTKKLAQDAASKKQFQCSQIYSSSLNHLSSIGSASKFTNENVAVVASAAKSLAEESQNAQVYSCPLIY